MIVPTSLWAVARQTFSQCLRMKIAVAFIVLLGVLLSILPFVIKGDGTLAGSIRTFLSYSVSATGMLLSLVTVLATALVITSDVEDKQIYLLAVKPVARWQYILGRWLGVLLLDALLLAIAAGVIYGVVRNMQGRQAQSSSDRRTIETEIFAARREVRPIPPNVDKQVEARVRVLQTSGQFDQTVQEFQAKMNSTRLEAEHKVVEEIRRNELANLESAGAGKRIGWNFQGLRLDEAVTAGQGTVQAEARQQRMFRIAAPREFLGKLMYDRPVDVDGIRGRVRDVSETDFDVQFENVDMQRSEIVRLGKDVTVQLRAEPAFQFRYKASAPSRTDLSAMNRQILFFSPERKVDGKVETWKMEEGFRGSGPLKTATTLTVPATGALREGTIHVEYLNPAYQPSAGPGGRPFMSPEIRIPTKSVSILYRVAGFELNFFQAMLLILIQLVFLAALAVFLASFLSFPVAAMTVLVLLGAGMLLGWLTDAIKWGGDFTNTVGAVMLMIVKLFMPSLAETSPSDTLVDGIYISWPVVGKTAGLAIGVRAVLYLAAGCLIFHRRELAKVQV